MGCFASIIHVFIDLIVIEFVLYCKRLKRKVQIRTEMKEIPVLDVRRLMLRLTFFLCIRFRPAGENSQFVEGVVLAGPVPQPVQKAPPSAGYRTHTHAGRQLVQEPPAEGSRRLGQEQVAASIHSRHLKASLSSSRRIYSGFCSSPVRMRLKTVCICLSVRGSIEASLSDLLKLKK